MLEDATQKSWAEAVYLNFPNQADRGAHVNVSGVVMTKYAKHPKAAQRLMEYLVGDQAQQLYAELNKEYPVKSGVALSPLVASWGQYRADDLPLIAIAKHRTQAMKLLDEVKFDL
jgi:iron(III) transport system substrate-binding protein